MKRSGIVQSSITAAFFLFATTALSSDYAFIQTGSPVVSKTYPAHIKGQEVSVYEMVSAIHQMNIPNGRQPVELWIHFPVIEDSTSGHVAFCRATFDQVQTDQHEMKSSDRFKPYLQINLDPSITQVITDEGVSAYQDSGVSCWEAMDPKSAP
jgi:hypothetical protein